MGKKKKDNQKPQDFIKQTSIIRTNGFEPEDWGGDPGVQSIMYGSPDKKGEGIVSQIQNKLNSDSDFIEHYDTSTSDSD